MKPIFFTLFALSLGAASGAAIANETVVEVPPKLAKLERASYHRCLDKARGRLEQAPCIQREKAWQLKQLDLLYQRLAALPNDEQRQALEKSQAAWKAFMDAETGFAASVYYPQSGSSDFSVSTHEIMWIVQRRQQLQQHLDSN